MKRFRHVTDLMFAAAHKSHKTYTESENVDCRGVLTQTLLFCRCFGCGTAHFPRPKPGVLSRWLVSSRVVCFSSQILLFPKLKIGILRVMPSHSNFPHSVLRDLGLGMASFSGNCVLTPRCSVSSQPSAVLHTEIHAICVGVQALGVQAVGLPTQMAWSSVLRTNNPQGRREKSGGLRAGFSTIGVAGFIRPA